ncbi:DUF6591 domain-containing protein [Bifidobacterium leontopitheci]|uniref:Permease n=1 Tax=Bifidobacterium leontopitheci TaxID=2650774 RepID=A0A6I1GM62_9BIFI|nr:DUF6591 domain-containing protein [Bifidobacterium leontopitheci]KAB7790676.1 permease [Bifidobacterium leontopitheci]
MSDSTTQPAQPDKPTADRIYATEPRQVIQAVRDLFAVNATFTLDSVDEPAGTVAFHDYDDATFVLRLTSTPNGTEARLDGTGDDSGKRRDEFYAGLDAQVSAMPAAPVQADRSGSASPMNPAAGSPAQASVVTPAGPTTKDKKTSKLAVLAVIVDALFLLLILISMKVGIGSWGLLVFLTLLPALLAGFAVYVTRKDGKAQGRILAWVAVGITAAGFILGGVSVIQGDLKDKAAERELQESLKVTCKEYTWPTSDLVARLPHPKSATGEINHESADSFSISVCDTDASQYDAYVSAVQAKGFTVDYSKSDTMFSGKDKDGYSVQVSVNDDNTDVMDISISKPDDSQADDPQTDDSQTNDSQTDGTGASSATEGKSSDGQSSGTQSGNGNASGQNIQSGNQSGTTTDGDFKAAVDSYEKFMNEYVDFMNKYASEGHPASMLVDYTKWMSQYDDMAKKFDALDDDRQLTAEEQQYYIDAQTRINQKLATMAQ